MGADLSTSALMASNRRRGFTLIELLVVVAVLAILMSLTMPAVQQAREAMRRTDCQQRMRQFGVALHNYHESHNVLPPGSIVLGPSFKTLSGWGWAAMVLPEIDQAPLYSHLNFSLGTAVGTNRNWIGVSVPLMRCPSDPAPDQLTVILEGHPDAVCATGNVVGCEGMLSHLSHTRFRDVSDGLSQTFLLGERLFHKEVAGSLPFTSSWCGYVSESDLYVFNSTPHVAASPLAQINRSASTPGNFSSQHPAGVNFAMGDGSIRFVSESIDHGIFEALGTPSGGEAVEF
jgi:prepilin-type N-terminal cleavage/methylation domain-containing protein